MRDRRAVEVSRKLAISSRGHYRHTQVESSVTTRLVAVHRRLLISDKLVWSTNEELFCFNRPFIRCVKNEAPLLIVNINIAINNLIRNLWTSEIYKGIPVNRYDRCQVSLSSLRFPCYIMTPEVCAYVRVCMFACRWYSVSACVRRSASVCY